MNEAKAADVLIIGRGGGSIEDLWAFNEESVARAVASSDIPVISAVGHETDFTICDFAADLRAPTPSAAAELAVPDSMEERGILLGYTMRARRAMQSVLQRQRLTVKQYGDKLRDPRQMLTRQRLLLDSASVKADAAMRRRMQAERHRFALCCGKLDALSPLRVLQRGYTITERQNEPLTRAQDVQAGDAVTIRFADGKAHCTVNDTEVSV